MIAIVVRQTTDWGNEAAVRAQLPENMRAGVDLWNATFNIPYHAYRQALKRIAEVNLSRVENARCIPFRELPEGVLAVPVDDDDWFAPDLAGVLEAGLSSEYDGCHWPSRFLEVPISVSHQLTVMLSESAVNRLSIIRRAVFPRARPKWLCTTNNYAVRTGPETTPLLLNHVRATYWFLEHPAAVKRIERPLSLMNRSLASMTQLRSRPSRCLLLRKFHRYQRLYARPAPKELAWCQPYLSMMRDLTAQLRVR